MKKLKWNIAMLILTMVCIACSAVGIVAMAENAEDTEVVPVADVVLQIDVEKNITTNDTNPNGVTTEGIVWKKLGKSGWNVANDQGCFSNIGNEANLKVGVLINLNESVNAKYFKEIKFSFFPGSTGTIYAYDNKTTVLTPENAHGNLAVTGMTKNTITLNTADFADENGKFSTLTLLLDRNDTTDWFFGTFVFVLKDEYYPVEDAVDFTLIATEDPATSPITGRVAGQNGNVNNVPTKYVFSGIQENGKAGEGGAITGGYLADKYAYSTKAAWNKALTATLIKLKTPVVASDYTTFTLNGFYGLKGDFSLYPSDAKRFIRENVVGSLTVDTAYKEYGITANASDLAKQDGKIYDITLAVENAVSSGQIFFKNIVLTKADGTTDTIDFQDRNDIITSDETNPNEVNLTAVIFDLTQKQSWADAGMGLCTRLAWVDAGTALVVEFKKPINSALYDKMEFTIHSGLKGTLEFYPAKATGFVPSQAAAIQEIKQYENNTIKIFLSDLADADGMVRNFTIYLPDQLVKSNQGGVNTAGQIFYGVAKVTARTETSYLDELVLTEGASKSITFEGAGEFITEGIPAKTGTLGAVDEGFALKIKGATTINFKKVINQAESEVGNIHFIMHKEEDSGVTKLSFGKVGSDTSVTEIATDKINGWFEVVLPVMDFLDEEGNIGSIVVTPTGEGETIFGGAYVEDKLRILNQKTTSVDISEVVPMENGGITFKSTGKVDYTPLFENTDMAKNIVKFKLKINDLSDFNVMFNLAGAGTKTNGIWFWFDKDYISMVGGSRCPYPAEVKANEYFNVEIGAIPYTVNFMPYGVKAYIKVNDKLMMEANIDATVQPTGKMFGCYVHQTAENTQVSVAPVNYTKTDLLTIKTQSGKTMLNIGDTDKLVVTKNVNLKGQEISKITVVSGDSVSIDELGFIKAEKAGITVFKVVASAIGVIPEKEYTITIEANKIHTVKIGNITMEIKDGGKIVLPELTPPKEGLKFAGLFTDEECKTKFDYENTPVTSDITLYVGWTENAGGGGCTCGSSVASLPIVTVSLLLIGFAIVVMLRKREDK